MGHSSEEECPAPYLKNIMANKKVQKGPNLTMKVKDMSNPKTKAKVLKVTQINLTPDADDGPEAKVAVQTEQGRFALSTPVGEGPNLHEVATAWHDLIDEDFYDFLDRVGTEAIVNWLRGIPSTVDCAEGDRMFTSLHDFVQQQTKKPNEDDDDVFEILEISDPLVGVLGFRPTRAVRTGAYGWL